MSCFIFVVLDHFALKFGMIVHLASWRQMTTLAAF